MPVATVSALPHPALGTGPRMAPLSGPASAVGRGMLSVPLLGTVPLALTAVPLVTPLLTTLPLVPVPLTVPDEIAETVPEPPVTVPALMPPLGTPELVPLPPTPLTRPPQAATIRSVGPRRAKQP